MKRYGPLMAVPEALAIGDPGRHHLRLTPDAVVIRTGTDHVGLIVWDEVEAITLGVPTTRFRLPGLVGTILLGAASALTLSDLGAEPDDGEVTIVTRGEAVSRPLSRHHVGGYWRPTVVGAHRLLARLIESPRERELLRRPEVLVELAATVARRDANGPATSE